MADRSTVDANPWAKPKVTGWRRWKWAIWSGGILLFLLLLVALAPSIASMGWARSIVLGQINSSLNGHVTVEDWSLGWTTGTEVRGLKVFDLENREILGVGHLQTDLTVMQLVRGDYLGLGNTKVEDLSFAIERDEEGVLNLERLSKSTGGGKPLALESFHGTFTVDFRGTITDRFKGARRVFIIDSSRVSATIPDINKEIEHELELNLRTGDGPPGLITAKGTIKAFSQGQFDLADFGAEEDLTLSSVSLEGFTPFLDPASPINMLKGQTSGKLKVRFTGQEEMQIEGQASSSQFAASGPALFGDTYASGEVALTIPPTKFNRATGRLQVGGDGIALKFAQGTVRLALDATQKAFMNVVQNQAPGEEGSLKLVADVDLPAIAKQLPKLMQLVPGVRIDTGNLHEETKVRLMPDRAVFSQQIELPNLSGYDTKKNRKLVAQPISLALDFTNVGALGSPANLRDLAVTVKSGFATVTGSGESIAKLDLKGTIDLAKAQAEAAQFFDLGKASVDGLVDFALSANGDLTREESAAAIALTLTSKDVKVVGFTPQPLTEPWMRLAVQGKLVRGKQSFLKSLGDAVVTLQTGNEQKPTVDVRLQGDLTADGRTIAVPRLEIEKFNVDLPAAQAELAPLLGSLQDRGIALPSGTIALSGSGSFDAAGARFKNVKLVTKDVSFDLQKQAVVSRYSATLELAGSVLKDEKGIEARLGKLSYVDQSRILSLSREGEGELVVSVPAGGGLAANGRLKLDADLKAINDIVMRISGRPVELAVENGRKKAGQLLSGRLAGTLELARTAGESSVIGNLTLSELGVTTFQKEIENERVTVAVRAIAKDDLSAISIAQLDFRSAFLSLILSDAAVQLQREGKPVSPLETVQRGRLFLDVPDVPRAKAMLEAILPQPAAAPTTQPVELVSGSARGTITLTRSETGLTLGVEGLRAGGFAFRRGPGQWGPRDLTLKLAATVLTQPDAVKPILEQITEIQVTALSGDLGVAKVELQDPILIKSPGGQAMSAAGGIRIEGRLQEIGQLMAAVEGRGTPGPEWDYAGEYAVEQKLATAGRVVTAAGTIQVREFTYGAATAGRSGQSGGLSSIFREELLKIGNEISLDQGAKVLELKGFSVEMQKSRALSVAITGGKIEQYDRQPVVNLTGKLGYDAAAIMKLVWPQLPKAIQEQLAGLKLSGVVSDRDFSVSGKLPPPEAKGTALLAGVKAQMSLYFDRIEYQGMTGERLELPIHLGDGKVATMYADREGNDRFARPATLNEGKLDIAGLEVTLNAEPLRITCLRDKVDVLENVTITREFMEKYLAGMGPMFAGAQEARGKISLTIEELKALRLDPLVGKPPAGDPGRVKMAVDIRDLRLKNKFTEQLKVGVNIQVNPDGTIDAAVHDGHAQLAQGEVTSRMDLELGGQTIQCRDGRITLADERIRSMNLNVPQEIIKQSLVTVPLRGPLVVPVTNVVRDPKIDWKTAIAKAVGNIDPLKVTKPSLPDAPGVPEKPAVPNPGGGIDKPSLPKPF